MRGEHEIYFDAANLAVATAQARLAMSLAFADCDAVLCGDSIGHCGFG
jgi:copper oxidase (laccase) domain-containing protein